MSEQPPLRMVNFTDSSGAALGQGRDGRSLSSLDKVTLALVVAVLLLAACAAGTFVTSPSSAIPPQGLLSRLQGLSVPLIGILTAVALLTAVGREWLRPVAIGPVNGLAGGALLLAGWAGLSLLIHKPVSSFGLNTLLLLFAALAVGGLISRLGRDRKALILLLLVVAGAGSLAAAFGVREYLEHWKRSDSTHRVFGTFSNPNFLAGYVLLTIPLTLSLFVSTRERMSRLLLGLGLALQTMCLLMTGSRSAAAMLLAVLFVWLFLLARASVLRGRVRVIGLGMTFLALSALLASAPLLMRVKGPNPPASGTQARAAGAPPAAETQDHSSKFRQFTWLGTLKMVRSNSLTGVGVGNYETAYPRYAITGYTAHAHNSFLQWMAETGVPGAFFLLVILAASTAFGTYVLFLNAPRRQSATPAAAAEQTTNSSNEWSDPEDTDFQNNALAFIPAPALALPYGFDEPRLPLAGLLAGVLATILHSLFDSDWYVVVTALTLSAVIGLLAALARDIAPLATQTPRPLSRPMLAGCGAVALLLLWRGGATYFAHLTAAQALEANLDFQYQAAHQDSHAADSLQSAIEGYRSAAALDPFDSEPLLLLSNLYQSQGKSAQALQALESAVNIAPTGKSYYQLGQYYRRMALKMVPSSSLATVQESNPIALSGTSLKPDTIAQTDGTATKGELNLALEAFNTARDRDPHSLQNLRSLAETYALLGKISDSMLTYRDMTALETTPLGTVRAIPEVIETDFAYAHARLASELNAEKHPDEALAEFQKADGLLKIYWTNRSYELYQLMSEDKRHNLNNLYTSVLEEWTALLASQGSASAESLRQVRAEQNAMQQDVQADEAAKAKAEPGAAQDKTQP